MWCAICLCTRTSAISQLECGCGIPHAMLLVEGFGTMVSHVGCIYLACINILSLGIVVIGLAIRVYLSGCCVRRVYRLLLYLCQHLASQGGKLA